MDIDVAHYENLCKRITGATLEDHNHRRDNLFLSDIATGKLNPARWIELEKMGAFCKHYGIIGPDDLEIADIDYDTLKDWNRNLPSVKFSEGGKQIRRIVAFRVNPVTHADAYKLYNTIR